jgi:spore coat protein A, manganese oxidase
MISRRKFLKISALAGAAAMFPLRFAARGLSYACTQSPVTIRKFVVPLPGFGPQGMPVLSPKTALDPQTGKLTDFYHVQMTQFSQKLHPDLPGETRLWGYSDAENPLPRYLGGAIVAQRGRPVRLKVTNRLPDSHPLPVDTSITGAGKDQPVNRATIHLHGGCTPWTSDGSPFSWFTPAGGPVGESFLNPADQPGSAEYYYPNDQSSRQAWYHDQALGLGRLNTYAGLLSSYLIRDEKEAHLIESGVVPANEIPLIIQDKTFVSGCESDYRWGKPGDLWYPHRYHTDLQQRRCEYGPQANPPALINQEKLPSPCAVPDCFGDTMLINGTCYPFLEVQPRHYRFRILNGSQARFYNLQLYYADASGAEADLSRPGPRMIQIGNEGGLLPFPVALNNPPVRIVFDQETGYPTRYNLLLAPGERADLVIDFSAVPQGARLILYNDAPAPFPGGDPRNDYQSNGPDRSGEGGAQATEPGMGPNSQTLMQFRVVPRVGLPDPTAAGILETLAVKGGAFFNNRYHDLLPALEKCDASLAARVRVLTLNRDFDDFGRLLHTLGTAQQNRVNNQGLPSWGRGYLERATEDPHEGDIEVWQICNLTGETQPIHFHLVNVNVLSRQPFDVEGFDGTPAYTGPASAPDANEQGWKETVRMNPGEVTTVIMKFALPELPFQVPVSPRTGGHEYVWHCQILEHGESDMMRPLVVQP